MKLKSENEYGPFKSVLQGVHLIKCTAFLASWHFEDVVTTCLWNLKLWVTAHR